MSYQFNVMGEEYIIAPKADTVSELPAGIYQIDESMQKGVFFKKLTPATDRLIRINDSFTDSVLNDVANFVSDETKARYKEYGVVHKRGYLLHGAPGTGKSATVSQVATLLVNQDAIVLFNPHVSLLRYVLPIVRQNNPEKLICIIMEEFETTIRYNTAELLSILDGELQVNNMVTIACTNYISQIPGRIKSRPSRFGVVIEVGVPGEEFRREFFKNKLLDKDQHLVENLVVSSEGMVVDEMKDLIVSHLCLLLPLDEAVRKIKEMKSNGLGREDAEESSATQALREYFGTKESDKGPLRPIR